jgi:hypothetical protein
MSEGDTNSSSWQLHLRRLLHISMVAKHFTPASVQLGLEPLTSLYNADTTTLSLVSDTDSSIHAPAAPKAARSLAIVLHSVHHLGGPGRHDRGVVSG